MTTYKHYDDFIWTGSLPSYWAQQSPGTWSTSNGAAVITANVDAQLIHQTDANLGLPKTHYVDAAFAFDGNADRVGVVMVSTSDATISTSRVVFRYERTANRFELIVDGVTYTAPLPTPSVLVTDGTTLNWIRLHAGYQGGTTYIFTAFVNGPPVLTSPPVSVAWSNGNKIGLVARRQSVGIVRCDYIYSAFDGSDNSHPQPTDPAVVARTPIVVGGESPRTSIGSFPVLIGVSKIRHRRDVRRFKSDLMHETSHLRFGSIKRVFDCYFIGSKADLDSLLDFHSDWLEDGHNAHFTVTIYPLGIGSIRATFIGPVVTKIVAQDVWRAEFVLAEVKEF